MEKTEMMKRYEKATGKNPICSLTQKDIERRFSYCQNLTINIPSQNYMDMVEAKAAAYDRLMSGNVKMTMQEMANFIGRPITIGKDGGITAHGAMPRLEPTRIGKFWYNDADDYEEIPESFVEIPDDFDWTTSLTLPDGWSEK